MNATNNNIPSEMKFGKDKIYTKILSLSHRHKEAILGRPLSQNISLKVEATAIVSASIVHLS